MNVLLVTRNRLTIDQTVERNISAGIIDMLQLALTSFKSIKMSYFFGVAEDGL